MPEVHIYYPPIHTGAAIAIEVKLLNEDNKPLLETIPVVVNLPESVTVSVSFQVFIFCN